MNSLLRVRTACGLSQQALADYIGVSRSLVKLAEKGLRDLPGTARDRLANLEDVVALDEFNQEPEVAMLDEKILEELKNRHKRRIEDCLCKLQGLRLRLKTAMKVRQNLAGKVKLMDSFSKKKLDMNQNEIHHVWTETHSVGGNERLSKYIDSIVMLNDEIEVHLGYIAVHEKLLKQLSE